MRDFNEAFSHRPNAGISLGVRIDGNVAVVSAAFLRRNADTFSRRTALQILRARLASPRTTTSGPIRFSGSFPVPEGTTARDFMNALRDQFKPDPSEEQSDRLSATGSRETQSNIIFNELAPYAANAVANSCAVSDTRGV